MSDRSPFNDRQTAILTLVAAGKTNKQIAAQLHLAENTVKWYLKEIFQVLRVGNRVQAVLLARQRGYLAWPERNAHAALELPAATTPFVGRGQEVAELRAMLLRPQPRLISIVGLGGVGKTRLALEVARQAADRFTDGVIFADLASLQSIEAIVPSLAQALRFTPSGGRTAGDAKIQLLDYLRDKVMLLVLDNFEELLEGASLLAEILAAGAQVKMLVTTRERLRIQAEHAFPLDGLPLFSWVSVSEAKRDPTVQLFLQHGRQVRPGFELQAEDLGALQRIFKLVQGMPLGIILAAGWVELLSPGQIAIEIERSLDFLQGEFRDLPLRQRSMRAILASGWGRLDTREKSLLAPLSVFRGGFTLDAAADIAGASPAALRRLLGRSLLGRGREGRFEIHELLRQFTEEQLWRTPVNARSVSDRHSAFYLTFLREAESGLKGTREEVVLSEMELDIRNHQAAWEWAVEQEQYAQLGLGAFSFATFFVRLGRYEEGLAAFGRAINRLRKRIARQEVTDPALLSTIVRLLTYQCWLQYESGDFKKAEALGEEALSLLERPELENVDPRQERGLALLRLARVYNWQDRTAAAERMLRQCSLLFEATGDMWLLAHTLRELGGVANRQAKFDQAARYNRQAVHLLAELGNRRQRAKAQVALGIGLAGAGHDGEAEKWMRDSIEICHQMGDEASAATAELFLAEIAAHGGRFDEARALAAESVQVHERLGRKLSVAMSRIRWCLALLHLGEYETVQAQMPRILEIARANDTPMNRAQAQFLLGCASLGLGESPRAREALGKATDELRRIGSWDYLCEALAALCCACIGHGEFAVAKRVLLEASRIAMDLEAALYLAPVAVGAALLFAVVGDAERAAELHALASTHPYVANSRWFEDVAGARVKAAAAMLPPEQFTAAATRGKERDLQEGVTAVLKLLEEIAL